VKKNYLTTWSEVTYGKNYTPSGKKAQDLVFEVLKKFEAAVFKRWYVKQA